MFLNHLVNLSVPRVLLPDRVAQVDLRRGLIWGFGSVEVFFMGILICMCIHISYRYFRVWKVGKGGEATEISV